MGQSRQASPINEIKDLENFESLQHHNNRIPSITNEGVEGELCVNFLNYF